MQKKVLFKIVKTRLRWLYQKDYISDKLFLTLMFLLRFGKLINWKNPKSFNEKMQYLKLYNRKDEYTSIVDKVKFKDWVTNKIGKEYVIPTLSVWNSPDEIDLEGLPQNFVIKCNHVSGGNYIHRTNAKPDKEKIKRLIRPKFERDFFKKSGEWPYKNVEKKVFAEEYMADSGNNGILDYKIYCFDGVPKFIQVNSDCNHSHFNEAVKGERFQIFYDTEWNRQEFIHGYPEKADLDLPRPKNFEKMIEIAAILSKGLRFVRVDLYNIDGRILVGEMTFFPFTGFFKFKPEEWDIKLGELINIRDIPSK